LLAVQARPQHRQVRRDQRQVAHWDTDRVRLLYVGFEHSVAEAALYTVHQVRPTRGVFSAARYDEIIPKLCIVVLD